MDFKYGSAKMLADLLGVHLNTVKKFVKAGILKAESRAKYNLAENVQAYLNCRLKTVDTTKKLDINTEKTLLLKARRELAELELETERSKYLNADAVEQAWAKLNIFVSARLLEIPAHVAPLVAGKRDVDEIKACLKREVYAALNELAEYDPRKENQAE